MITDQDRSGPLQKELGAGRARRITKRACSRAAFARSSIGGGILVFLLSAGRAWRRGDVSECFCEQASGASQNSIKNSRQSIGKQFLLRPEFNPASPGQEALRLADPKPSGTLTVLTA